MPEFSQNLVAILQYLLPGFLAAWVFYGLVPHVKPSQFERVVQALIFTLLTQVISYPAKFYLKDSNFESQLSTITDQFEVLVSVIFALILGLLFAWVTNNDLLHKLARAIGMTKQTSYPSEWFAAFNKETTFVVLHLYDGRRLYGWPSQWPSDPKTGHFLITLPSWLIDDTQIPLESSSSILINSTDVKWVEFMKRIKEVDR